MNIAARQDVRLELVQVYRDTRLHRHDHGVHDHARWNATQKHTDEVCDADATTARHGLEIEAAELDKECHEGHDKNGGNDADHQHLGTQFVVLSKRQRRQSERRDP